MNRKAKGEFGYIKYRKSVAVIRTAVCVVIAVALFLTGLFIYGSQKNVSCRFFDTEAHFPLGPFALAAQRSLPVLQVSVMKERYKHYHVHINDIAHDIDPALPIRQRSAIMAQRFADGLEDIVRKYPTQWYNYFDFWAS